MTPSFKRAFLLCVSAITLLAVPLHADSVVFSENFDELSTGAAVSNVGAFQTLGGTNVDIVGGAFFGNLCAGPESGNCIDMGGSGGKDGGQLGLKTLLNLQAGTYNLSFDLIGSQRGTATSTEVTLGSFIDATITFNDGSIITPAGACPAANCLAFSQQFVVVGTQTVNLEFLNKMSNDQGALLDNVSVSMLQASTQSSSPVPEPGAFGLMATGLLGVVGAIRRRF